MRILYDHQMFSFQKFGGISRYFTDLITNLPVQFDYCLPIRYSENYYLQEADILTLKQINILSSFRIKRQYYYYYNQHLSGKIIRENKFDLFHPTYYDPYFLKGLKQPYVITIHDMIHEKFRESFSLTDKTSRQKRLLAVHADHIIAVSENTKKDIIELFNIPASKISVVYHGYNQLQKASARLFEHYILYVGERKGYKNFHFFIEAITPLLNKDKDLKVVCTGQAFTKEENIFLKELKIRDQVFQTSVNDADLASLYKYAELFIYPSCYEGFGIPILEAYTNNCPVCLSNASCFPEIAGDAACYFDPLSKESILVAVEKILTDTMYANSLREKGSLRLQEFSVMKMANNTCKIYEQYR